MPCLPLRLRLVCLQEMTERTQLVCGVLEPLVDVDPHEPQFQPFNLV